MLSCVIYHTTQNSHTSNRSFLFPLPPTLLLGRDAGVPVSPFWDDVESIVVKHKSIEGGMGIHFFKNATHGGDWIIQKRIENAKWLNDLLPKPAPLSTMRVITFSTCDGLSFNARVFIVVPSRLLAASLLQHHQARGAPNTLLGPLDSPPRTAPAARTLWQRQWRILGIT
jgi:hypothetical protein